MVKETYFEKKKKPTSGRCGLTENKPGGKTNELCFYHIVFQLSQ